MNTNLTKEQIQTIKKSWSSAKIHSVVMHIIYNALRGKDVKLGFTPVSNPNKLRCHKDPLVSFKNAKYDAIHTLYQDPNGIRVQNKKILEELFGIEFTYDLSEELKRIINAE